MPSSKRILLIQGSARTLEITGPTSRGVIHGISAFIEQRFNSLLEQRQQKGRFELVTLEPATRYNLPWILGQVPRVANGAYLSKSVKEWSELVKSSSAVIIATPQYNGLPPPNLILALDSLLPEWNGKIAGLIGYGPNGSTAAVNALRDNMIPILGMKLLPQAPMMRYTKDQMIKGEITPDSAKDLLADNAQMVDELLEALLKQLEDIVD